jgi:1-deoxy-D-xylulose-5-phosphate reductoisomerase
MVKRNMLPPTRIAVLGSTGSIGRSTLEVVQASEGMLTIDVLAACRSTGVLLEQAKAFRPRWLVVADREAADRQDWNSLPKNIELRIGPEALIKTVQEAPVDIVVSAIVGSAGLLGTWAALETGKTVALANKESLVVGGPLITEMAKIKGAKLLPVDSEHSAIFQALQTGNKHEVRRIILTASGGPFLNHNEDQLAKVTIADALAHPTWAMGPKITIDSATLMNKALEIIEARWLFDLEPEQIEVVIHPQSIVHSMVEFLDGSVIAQLSVPDMKLPIQYALTWPRRLASVAAKMDWSRAWALSFEPPDLERFAALRVGQEAARAGGTAGAVLNGANEAAVAAFLEGRLPFSEIVPVCEKVLKNHPYDPRPSLEQLIRLDSWAREEVFRLLNAA